MTSIWTAPETTAACIFTIFYAPIGILNIALAVTTMRGLIAESFRHARHLHRKRAAQLKGERERKRTEILRLEQEKPPNTDSIVIGGGRRGPGLRLRRRRRSSTHKFVTHVWHAIRYPFGIKHEFEDQDSFHRDFHHDTGPLHAARHDDKHLLFPRSADPNLEETIEDELRESEEKENVRQLTLALITFIGFWLLGSLVFHTTEKWSYGTAMYFCFISWTTIGYGDLTPKSSAGRAVFVLWALLGVGSLTILISVIGEAYAGVFGAALRNRTFEALVYRRVRARHESIAEEREKRINDFTEQLREDKLKLADALIEHAHTYHPHLRFMLGVEKRSSHMITVNLRNLLVLELGDDCDHVARDTILHDPEIRKTLFIMSYDASFERLMQIANAIQAMETPDTDGPKATEEGNNHHTAHRNLHPALILPYADV